MNETNVLHREGGAHNIASSDAGSPPSTVPAPPIQGPRASWPMSAKVLVALLLVATVISTVAAVVVANGDGDGDGDEGRQEQIDTLTAEREAALREIAELDEALTAVRVELEESQAVGDELTAERDALVVAVESLTAERDEAVAELAAVNEALVEITAERDALLEGIDVEFDVSLVGADLVGTYRATTTDVVGAAPVFTQLTIGETPEGWLSATIPGIAEGGMAMADGVLHLVTDSTTALPQCDGVDRLARIVMTIYPNGYEVVGAEGDTPNTVTISGLNAVLTVSARAAGTCDAVVAVSTADLVRTS